MNIDKTKVRYAIYIPDAITAMRRGYNGMFDTSTIRDLLNEYGFDVTDDDLASIYTSCGRGEDVYIDDETRDICLSVRKHAPFNLVVQTYLPALTNESTDQ